MIYQLKKYPVFMCIHKYFKVGAYGRKWKTVYLGFIDITIRTKGNSDWNKTLIK